MTRKKGGWRRVAAVEITRAIDKSVNSDDSIENYLTGMRSLVTAGSGDGNEIAVRRCYTLDITFSAVYAPHCFTLKTAMLMAGVSNLSAEIFLHAGSEDLEETFLSSAWRRFEWFGFEATLGKRLKIFPNINCNKQLCQFRMELFFPSILPSRIFAPRQEGYPSFFYPGKILFQRCWKSWMLKGYPLANILVHSKNPLDTFFGRVPRTLKCSRAITVLFPVAGGGRGKVNANPLFPLATGKKNAFFTPLGVISFKRAPCKNFPRKRFQRPAHRRARISSRYVIISSNAVTMWKKEREKEKDNGILWNSTIPFE